MLNVGRKEIEITVPYAKAAIVEQLHREAEVLSIEYVDDGIQLRVIVDEKLYGRVRVFLNEQEDDEPEF